MIISFKHNYLFVRTKKTASSTVQTVLAQSMGPDDVWTHRGMTETPRLLNGAGAKEELHAHMTAEEILPWLPPGFFEGAFKFTVERHPYEKAVSLAHFRWKKREKLEGVREFAGDFETHLEQVVRGGGYAGHPYYSIGGKTVVDDFIRQEDLLPDLKRIGEKIGIAIPDELPQKKTRHRKDSRPAREVLSEAQKEIVFETCRPEFERFGYER
jgi:hypothetical protein